MSHGHSSWDTRRVLDQFRAAMLARDIVPPEHILADGQIHRCNAAGRNGRGDASYLLHLDGLPAGGLENHRDGLGWERWRYDLGRGLTAAEREVLACQMQSASEARELALHQRHEQARLKAARIWALAQPASASHPYLVHKGVEGHGVRVFRGMLVVPVRALHGSLLSLQFISPGSRKRFMRGGQVQGLCSWVGELPPAPGTGDITVYLAEGFATAVSLHQALGQPVVVAFHAGNLVAVATALRERYPRVRLVVCADDDHFTPGNPGRTMAMAAARAVAGELAAPIFPGERPAWATDFNDLHRLHGLSAVQTALTSTETAMDADPNPAAADPETHSGDGWSEDSWPLPEPLTASMEAQPYPTDALPALLREAVLEAQAFVQAPDALVACSALSTLSLAGQGLANVRRDQRLVGPVSLYLLSVAESGERKTTCDRIFGAALRDWEMERLAACEPELLAHDLATATYEAKRAGLLEAIKRKRRDGQSTVDDEQALKALATEVPEPVKVPRLMYADATPEALSHALATGWPSAAVMSAEAGAVFGAHGMGYETILRNLALLNVLWDGGEIAVDRRSKSSFRLRDRRLTFGVMVQPEALRGFIERAGALPRGSGFIARFLIAWPASTQGHRPYRAAPAAMPAVDRFNARIRTLLNTLLRTDAKGGLQPAVLDLSPAAHTVWVQAHDHIERQLCDGGRYAAIRDVAAKAAENIARVAALLHLLDHGPSAEIGATYVEAAVRIVAWHLDESLRLLADLDATAEMASAIRFDAWLRSEASRTGETCITAARIYQYGPGCVRDQKDLKQALALLEERGRVRVVIEGRRRFVVVNPALLDSSSAAS